MKARHKFVRVAHHQHGKKHGQPHHIIPLHHVKNASDLLGMHKPGLKPGQLIRYFLEGIGSMTVVVSEEMYELSNKLARMHVPAGNATPPPPSTYQRESWFEWYSKYCAETYKQGYKD
jgi:hypothetical protein